jgi:hypothetical protein
MIEKEPNLIEELYSFFFKIFIPAFIALSIKIATQVKREKMTFTRVVLSFVVGIGCAYFVYPFVENQTESKYIPLLVGVVSISGDKIAEYIIYKWNVDNFVGVILDSMLNAIVQIFKPNNKN